MLLFGGYKRLVVGCNVSGKVFFLVGYKKVFWGCNKLFEDTRGFLGWDTKGFFWDGKGFLGCKKVVLLNCS